MGQAAKIGLVGLLLLVALYIAYVQYVWIHHSHYTLEEALASANECIQYNVSEWLHETQP